MKPLAYVSAFFLLLAICPFPIGYYTFLRIIVTVVAIIIAFKEAQTQRSIWILIFLIIAIIFNPVIPVYLYKKSLWMLIDILSALIFLVYAFKKRGNYDKQA